jgi:SnoaL-like protein
MNDTTDKDRIIDTATRLFISTDNRDWSGVKTLFAPSVLFDMTSLAGGQPVTTMPQEIVDGWDKGLKFLKGIHHQAGNFLVDVGSEEASVFCYGIAWHYLPNRTNNNTRTFFGSYDIHLAKLGGEWKIDRFKFNLKFMDGNPELEQS